MSSQAQAELLGRVSSVAVIINKTKQIDCPNPPVLKHWARDSPVSV